jgi:hypothetical protein
MSQFAWPEPVTTLSAMLNTLEGQVGRGDLSTPGLAEFKSALDDLRLRAWMIPTRFRSGSAPTEEPRCAVPSAPTCGQVS